MATPPEIRREATDEMEWKNNGGISPMGEERQGEELFD
jgi:hypothetical protein